MKTRFWKIALFMGLLLAVSLSVSLTLELPTPSGPFAVGRTMYRWVDTSRQETMTEDRMDYREVPVLIWYPAVEGTGTKAGYFPEISALSTELAKSGELAWWEAFGLGFIRSESNLDSRPVKNQGRFPVVILSPGNGTNIELYSSLAGEIASHGYVVAGLNHPYDVMAVRLQDGGIAPYNRDQWSLDRQAHQAYTAERIKVRSVDVSFVMEQLAVLNSDSSSVLAGLLDLDSVAVAGHSLGGITASEACKADARLMACLNLDGMLAGGPFSTDESSIPPRQPFLFLTKEAELHPELIGRFESTTESYWVAIPGASHESFTDGPLLQPTFIGSSGQADRIMKLIQKYTLAFLDQTLRGQSGALLSAPAFQEEVAIRKFPTK